MAPIARIKTAIAIIQKAPKPGSSLAMEAPIHGKSPEARDCSGPPPAKLDGDPVALGETRPGSPPLAQIPHKQDLVPNQFRRSVRAARSVATLSHPPAINSSARRPPSSLSFATSLRQSSANFRYSATVFIAVPPSSQGSPQATFRQEDKKTPAETGAGGSPAL